MVVHVIELPLQRPPLTSNGQRRAHWTEVRKLKGLVEQVVTTQARQQLPAGLTLAQARVRVTWYAPDARRRDSDALGPFLKAALDALTKISVLKDDDSRYVLESSQRIIIDRARPRITLELDDVQSDDGIVTISEPAPSKASSTATVRVPAPPVPKQAPPRPAASAPSIAASKPVPALQETSGCTVCGKEIQQPETGRPRLTCSGACRVKACRQKRAAAGLGGVAA